MTTITLTTLFFMIVCLVFIALGFYFIGFQDGKENERGGAK